MAALQSIVGNDRKKPLSDRQLKQLQKWVDDDWESSDIDREAVVAIQRLLVTIEKGRVPLTFAGQFKSPVR